MRQTLHIFKKDARHLKWEIALTLLLLAAFAYSDARQAWVADVHAQWGRLLKLFVPVAWFILIVRVIQSDALTGSRQFWLTRPYSWRNLLAAKALFLLAFITLPLTIADAAIVTAQGFPASAHLTGLIWMQLIWWISFLLPVAVLAAITSGLAAAIFWAVVIVAAGVSSVTQDLVDPLGSLEWVGNSIYLGLTSSVIVAVLLWQYARRSTNAARIVFGCAMVLGSLAPILPLSAVLPLREPVSVTVGMEPGTRPVIQTDNAGRTVRVAFPLQIADVPAGLTPHMDFSQVRIDKAGGGTLVRGHAQYPSSVREAGDIFWLSVSMDPSLFDQVKSQPVRIQASLLLTLYRNRKTVTLPAGSQSIPVPEVGLCNTNVSPGVLYQCRAPFRGPRLRLSIEGNSDWVYTPSSPFPAELGLSPIWIYGLWREPHLSVPLTLEEPTMHLRRVLTLDNIRLTDN